MSKDRERGENVNESTDRQHIVRDDDGYQVSDASAQQEWPLGNEGGARCAPTP